MFRPWEKFADLVGVSASGTATADIPVAGTYFGLHFVCLDGGAAVSLANMKSDISNVKLTVDGSVLYEADADFILDLYEHKYALRGGVAQAGVLPVILAPDHWSLNRESSAIGWGMKEAKSFQVEFTLGASVGTAGHIDQIQCFVERIPENRPLGEHYRLLKYIRNFASSGVQEVTEIPTEGGRRVATTGWHIQHDGSAAVINNIEALVNNQSVFNIPPLVAKHRNEKAGRKWMVSAAAKDVFSLPFDLSNDANGYLPHAGLNDLRFRLNWSAAPGTYSLYRESFHNIGDNNR